MLSLASQLFAPDLCELPIQPTDDAGNPISLPEIARRIREQLIRCPKCRALVGMRLYLEVQPPGQPGVLVPPHPYTYKVMVPCVLCGENHDLTDLIKTHNHGGDHR